MPRRKPASERQNRETRDLGLVRLATAGVPTAPKPAGKPMLKRSLDSWTAFWSSDVAGCVTDADRPALERLWSLYDMRERMLRVFLRTPFEKGSMDQVIVHPAAKEMASLDKRILPLEHDFGITPAGRLHLGIAFGAAAKSLEDMNARFDSDDGSEEDDDPRLRAIEGSAAG